MPSKYFAQIQEILETSLIDINRVKSRANGIEIKTFEKKSITFQYAKTSELSKILHDNIETTHEGNFGVILDTLDTAQKRNLETSKISYITLEGDFCLHFENRFIKNALSKPRTSKTNHSTRESWNKINALSLPAPTELISPYGLQILDVLFRLPNNNLSTTTPHKLCKEFNLNHGRLFRMLASMDTKDLISFKQIVRKLPISWWTAALTYPRTNQRLFSFQKNSETYVSFAKDNSLETYQALEETREKHGAHSIIMGPAELLKQLGYLTNDDIQFWVVGDEPLKTFKRLLRLTPNTIGMKGMKVSTSKIKDEKDLIRQGILSRAPDYGELNSETREINYFRAIWDTSNGDTRLQSASIDFLKERILK